MERRPFGGSRIATTGLRITRAERSVLKNRTKKVPILLRMRLILNSMAIGYFLSCFRQVLSARKITLNWFSLWLTPIRNPKIATQTARMPRQRTLAACYRRPHFSAKTVRSGSSTTALVIACGSRRGISSYCRSDCSAGSVNISANFSVRSHSHISPKSIPTDTRTRASRPRIVRLPDPNLPEYFRLIESDFPIFDEF